jgi:prephenate dehydrogenase
MTTPKITIIGLGLTGTSIGLGLQRQEGDFEIVGHDKEPEITGAAKKAGAINRSEWNLHKAYEGADMVILAVPLSELDELLELMAEGLKPGALLMAAVNVMQPAIEIANTRLSDAVHFVAGHPILTGVGGSLSPRADLFEDAVFCLAPSLNADPNAVQLASDFVERLGANPLFVDAQEHDGIIAGVEQLPQIMAAALMRTSISSPGWAEAQRMAGRRFAQATELGSSADQIFSSLETNRANLAYRIEQLQRELGEWKRLLEMDAPEEGEHPLLTALKKVVRSRNEWEIHAELKRWDLAPTVTGDEPEQRGFMRQMFLGNFFKGRPRPTDEKK